MHYTRTFPSLTLSCSAGGERLLAADLLRYCRERLRRFAISLMREVGSDESAKAPSMLLKID